MEGSPSCQGSSWPQTYSLGVFQIGDPQHLSRCSAWPCSVFGPLSDRRHRRRSSCLDHLGRLGGESVAKRRAINLLDNVFRRFACGLPGPQACSPQTQSGSTPCRRTEQAEPVSTARRKERSGGQPSDGANGGPHRKPSPLEPPHAKRGSSSPLSASRRRKCSL